MTQTDKESLLAKADALRWSYADSQLQSIMGVVAEVINALPVDDGKEMGFTTPEKRGSDV